MPKKALGGERIHTGDKISIDLKEYGYSNHNLERTVRTTAAMGTLIPLATWVALPADTFQFHNIQLDVKTHPTLGPLFGSAEAAIDIFEAPWRLYLPKLHNNTSDIATNMEVVKLPQVEVKPIHQSAHVVQDNQDVNMTNPSSLYNYLGIKSAGYWNKNEHEERPTRTFNAIDILAYYDLGKNYYSNKQEKVMAMIDGTIVEDYQNVSQMNWGTVSAPSVDIIPHWPTAESNLPTNYIWISTTDDLIPDLNGIYAYIAGTGFEPITTWQEEINEVPYMGDTYWVIKFQEGIAPGIISWAYGTEIDTDGEPKIRTFPIENIDRMRDDLLANVLSPNALVINELDYPPFNWITRDASDGTTQNIAYKYSQEGLLLKTYKSDIFNNWLNTTDINETLTRASVNTTGGTFNMDSLILAQRVYNMLNELIAAGNTYDDFLETMYNVRGLDKCNFPIYHGGVQRNLVFQEVVSTAENEQQPLGTLAGKGVLTGRDNGGLTIRCTEFATIMAIFHLTPRVDYSQGNDWQTGLQNIAQLHVPAMDQIGFQDAITEYANALDTYWDGTKWVQRSYGKQPAWIQYMTDYNRTYGNFASSDEMFMTFNRNYEVEGISGIVQVKDMTTYIDPSKFNFIFADTDIDAQNYWVQAHFDLEVRRKMSSKIMPNL